MRVTLVEASGVETIRRHVTLAGERHLLALDFGRLPREVVDRHQEAYAVALAAGDADEAEAEALHLLGAQYLHDLGRGQSLTRVDAGNVSTVLVAVDLGADVEQEVEAAVARGRIAWVAEDEITVNRWTGTGYVLEDPETGAAGYLISGSLGGGSDTGEPLESLQDLLGSEDWLEGSPLGALLRQLFDLVGGGGDSDSDGPSTQQSDPINLSTGNMWRTETDLTIQARGLPLVWSRTYNSRSAHSGAFGHGWTFSYGESLEERTDGSVLYREADGTEQVFATDSSGRITRIEDRAGRDRLEALVGS